MTDRLHRLHRALVDELARRDHEPGRPIKVAELYEELVPYRMARSILDVHVRADYEHTLLRLLAGEASLARIEPDEARDELRREIDRPYPDVSLYRKFAASDVFVSPPAAADVDPPERPAEPRRGDEPGPAAGTDPGGTDPVDRLPDPDRTIETSPDVAAEARPGEDPGVAGGECVFCGRALPADRPTRFCPLCGGDQRQEPCARCGEPLEPAWRFCIACGQETRER